MAEYSIENFSIGVIGSDLFIIIGIPLVLLFMGLGIREFFEAAPRRALVLWAQLTEALMVPGVLLVLSSTMPGLIQWALANGEYDRAVALAGLTLASLLPGALYLAVGYVVVRVFGYCKQTKPLPRKWALALFAIVFACIIRSINYKYHGVHFACTELLANGCFRTCNTVWWRHQLGVRRIVHR